MPCTFGEYIPDPTNCAKYFRCVFGELKRESCIPGLHWDGNRRFCDWPYRVKCQQNPGKLKVKINLYHILYNTSKEYNIIYLYIYNIYSMYKKIFMIFIIFILN